MAKKLYKNPIIDNLLQKYGLINFRMGLYHLIDCGIRNLTDEKFVEKQKKLIVNQEKQQEIENEEKRKKGERCSFPIMTGEFQCMLVDIAHELTKVGITELLKWIQDNLYFDMR